MYRMMKLFQKKKEIVESAGMKYRWSFFDVVFELVRVERYENLKKDKVETKRIPAEEVIKLNIQEKIEELKSKKSTKIIKQISKKFSTGMRSIEDTVLFQKESQMMKMEKSKEEEEEDEKDQSMNGAEENLFLKYINKKVVNNQVASTVEDKQIESKQVIEELIVLEQEQDVKIEIVVKESLIQVIRAKCKVIIEQKYFSITMTMLILANCLLMSLERYPSTDIQDQVQNIFNYFFYIIFIVEMILKVTGLGPKAYFRDKMNLFDAVIVLLSTVDVIFNNLNDDNATSSSLSVLRSLRIGRLVKIVKSWSKLQELLETIYKTLLDLRNFLVLLFICMFAFTLLGMQFFANKVKFNEFDEVDDMGISPRLNFDTFFTAFLSVFVIFQGDQWEEQLYNVVRACGGVSIFFFVSIVIFGQIILLKLFLAVLLENFEDKRKEIEEKSKTNKPLMMFDSVKTYFSQKFKYFRSKQYLKDQALVPNNEIIENSLYIFKPRNPIRRFCIYLTNSQKFEIVIILFILASSIALAIENPLEPSNSKKNIVLDQLNIAFTIVFTIEIFIKVIAKGLIFNGKDSYLRSYWNLLDFLIDILSIIAIGVGNSKLKIFKVLRTIRILRPLRVISRNEGLKLAVSTLIHVIPNVFNVALVSVVLYFSFAVFCVTFNKGELFYCYNKHMEREISDLANERIVTKYDCIDFGGEWVNRGLNFDNILNGMLLLYTMSLTNWTERMMHVVDATSVGSAPIKDKNPFWMIFFAFFTIVYSFFLLNLFVGVVVGTFNEQKEKLGKNFLLTSTQKEWLTMKIKLLSTKPQIKKKIQSQNCFRKFCFKVMNHKSFEIIIMTAIVLNTLALSINWYGIDSKITNSIKLINYIFSALFLTEAFIKIVGHGKAYFKEGWNIFDLIIVIASIIGIILDFSTNIETGGQATVIRAFRVARVFRIIQRAKVLRIIIDTFIVSLPSLLNVGGLLFLILFIYSVLGVQLFAGIKLQTHLNVHANFQDFSSTMMTLLRTSTGEEWDLIMEELMMGPSIINQCKSDFDGDIYQLTGQVNGCGSNLAIIYFVSLSLILTIVFWNLFVAIVLQNFQDMNNRESKLLSEKNMDTLREKWAEFDEEGTGFLEIQHFEIFLENIGPPFGFGDAEKSSMQMKSEFMKRYQLPTYNGMKHYYYYDVITTLTQCAYVKLEAEKKMKQQFMMESGGNFVDILSALEKELDFQEEIFKQKEIQVFQIAHQKEETVYKKIQNVKDDLDSQHLWAGGKIKNMYKNTKMIFNGGMIRKVDSEGSPINEKERLPDIGKNMGGKELRLQTLNEIIREEDKDSDNESMRIEDIEDEQLEIDIQEQYQKEIEQHISEQEKKEDIQQQYYKIIEIKEDLELQVPDFEIDQSFNQVKEELDVMIAINEQIVSPMEDELKQSAYFQSPIELYQEEQKHRHARQPKQSKTKEKKNKIEKSVSNQHLQIFVEQPKVTNSISFQQFFSQDTFNLIDKQSPKNQRNSRNSQITPRKDVLDFDSQRVKLTKFKQSQIAHSYEESNGNFWKSEPKQSESMIRQEMDILEKEIADDIDSKIDKLLK